MKLLIFVFFFTKLFQIFAYIATGSLDEFIKIWDHTSGKLLAELKNPDRNCAPKVLLNINDCTLAAGTSCSTIDFWDLETGSIIKKLVGHTREISSLKLFKDNILASSSTDNTIRIWNLETYSLMNTFKEYFWILSLEILDDETLACGLNDGTITIYNIKNGTKMKTIAHGEEIDSVFSLLLLKDGYFASADKFNKISIWDTNNWRVVKSVNNTGAFRMTQYGENFIYFIGRLNELSRLDLNTMIVEVLNKNSYYESIKLLCDGSLVLSISMPYKIQIWNTTTLTYTTINAHDKNIYSIEEVGNYPTSITNAESNNTNDDPESQIMTSTERSYIQNTNKSLSSITCDFMIIIILNSSIILFISYF